MSSKPPPDEVGSDRPLRADAARNRERIVTAARELYAAHGLSVGLNEVAHHAGLGVGTVYRRFPDKRELVRAALADPLRDMTEVAAQALLSERAWDGIVMLIERGAAQLTANLGLRDMALGIDQASDALDGQIEEFARIGRELMERARSEGDLRPGVANDDLTIVLWMVTELAVHSMHVRPDAYRRYLRLLTDGLRMAPGRTALEPELSQDELTAIVQHWATH